MSVNVNKNGVTDSIQLATILVNWCQPQRTVEAVKAVANQTQSSLIIVVDNGSNDDSVEYLKNHLPAEVLLITRTVNGGFGTGVNEGIKAAYSLGVKYVWLLNNDAIPESNCLEKLVKVAESDEKIGVVGARIIDPSGSVPDHAGTVMDSRFFNCKYSLSSEEINNSKFAWITGACMLLNVKALRQVGEFDTRFFMYWEDADLCIRLKKSGYALVVALNAIISHEAGTSSENARIRRFLWHIESQNLWIQKNYKPIFFGWLVIFIRQIFKSIISFNLIRLKETIVFYCKKIIL